MREIKLYKYLQFWFCFSAIIFIIYLIVINFTIEFRGWVNWIWDWIMLELYVWFTYNIVKEE